MTENSFSREKEYYTLFEIINKYDDRFITVKGWGVTVSMAALGAGFQFGHYGLFLVACVSSIAFWMIEGTIKRHQMRYYVRMRDLEIPDAAGTYKPQIDWGWFKAPDYYKGVKKTTEEIGEVQRYGPRKGYRLALLLPSVVFPHVISCVAGATLFLMGLNGKLHLVDGRTMPI